MLDWHKIFFMRLFDILNGDIVLKIQPSPPLARHMPQRGDVDGGVFGLGQDTASGGNDRVARQNEAVR